jgi:hypothetical protein
MESEEINNEFVPHKESLLLKEIGFNAPCLIVYSEEGKRSPFANFFACNSNVPSYATGPTYRQALTWFREKHKLVGYSLPYADDDDSTDYFFIISIRSLENNYDLTYDSSDGEKFKTYEEGELFCIQKLIETVKNKK